MTIEEQIQYWIDGAERDLPVAEHLFEKGDYSWCLFIGHLVLEKMLKGIYVRDVQKYPLKTHDLVKLANLTTLNMNDEDLDFLSKVNDFHIEARYPEYKKELYNKCTKEFTEENFNKIKRLHKWLKSNIQP